jgi:uncharacterized protein YbbC (DUF1343 family)
MCLATLCHTAQNPTVKKYEEVVCGAARFDKYLPLLKGKRVAVLTNPSGRVGNRSLVDTLLSLGVNLCAVFSPEHGFRGDADAGEKVSSGKDLKTGLPVISLYGKSKKPTPEQLKNIDVLLYDIQDLGARFYTYVSTMCYAMEACAENRKSFIVLDRLNPNGFYVDGPVLEKEWQSFLGLHPVPMVYGMTCGEYAQMANGEGWLNKKVKCRLTVVTLENYDRNSTFELPVKPSPNIPNHAAILLYPSLGLFEGTIMSLGRGTEFPFQVVGHPAYPDTTFCFVPQATLISKEPKHVKRKCYGLDLSTSEYLKSHPHRIELGWLREVYSKMQDPAFFDKNFNYHAGNALLQEQIKNSVPEADIRKSWEPALNKFRTIRKKYLLYQ